MDRVYNDLMLRYRIPGKMLHDQGKEFENSPFVQLSKLCGIKCSRTTSYHPQTYKQTERMNQILVSMLKTLPDQHKTQWRNHINKLVPACSCTKHAMTSFTQLLLDVWLITMVTNRPDYVNCYRNFDISVKICSKPERANEGNISRSLAVFR